MELSKEEMEDIWSNKPYGHLKVIKGKMKGKKMYSVTIQPYKTAWGEKIEMEVIASSKSVAEWQAKENYRKEHSAKTGFTSCSVFSVYEKKSKR